MEKNNSNSATSEDVQSSIDMENTPGNRTPDASASSQLLFECDPGHRVSNGQHGGKQALKGEKMQNLAYATYTTRFILFTVASIIRRRAMIKELAASYHAECLSYCQDLLELQRRWEQEK